MMAAGLLDTSVFIATESHRPLKRLPGQVAVSVVTIGELKLGVLSAAQPEVRARRAATLDLARSADPIPLTESSMDTWARLVDACRKAGVQRAVKLTDSLIAATAVDMGLPVVTQGGDFDALARAFPELSVERV